MACTVEFQKGDRVVSLVCHLPEIMPGTEAEIYSGRIGDLYAVQLPNGELHRWFAAFELQPCRGSGLCPGSFARVLTADGHGPHIMPGMVVKIVKAFCDIDFYDAIVHGEYHRWFVGFEIVPYEVTCKRPEL